MSAAIPTAAPALLTAGDTATWQICLGDYRAGDGWALTYSFNKRGSGYRIAITSSASNDEHLVSVDATTTAGWLAGTYDGQGYATKAAERYLVWLGSLTILPNFATADTDYDSRSTARKILESIEAAILKTSRAQEAGAAGGIVEWSAEGLSVKRATPEALLAELTRQRDRYASIVATEELKAARAAGRGTGRRILTQFRNP